MARVWQALASCSLFLPLPSMWKWTPRYLAFPIAVGAIGVRRPSLRLAPVKACLVFSAGFEEKLKIHLFFFFFLSVLGEKGM